MTGQALDVAALLSEAGQSKDEGTTFFLDSGNAFRLPHPMAGIIPAPTRVSVHIAGFSGEGRGSGGWAALALETDPSGTLTAPVRLWKGSEASPITQARLEAIALCAALTALADAPALPITITLSRDPQALSMKARLASWRDAGWIGERWTKIPDVDLWRQIAGHAERLEVSWQSAFGQQPGLWDCIASAIAKRAALSDGLSFETCRTPAASQSI